MLTGPSPAALPVQTFAGALWPARPGTSEAFVRGAILVLLGSFLLTLSAKVQVPFWPVPITMQSLVVLMLGAAYGWRLGAAAVGATIYFGSKESNRQIQEVSAAFERAAPWKHIWPKIVTDLAAARAA